MHESRPGTTVKKRKRERERERGGDKKRTDAATNTQRNDLKTKRVSVSAFSEPSASLCKG